MSTMWDLVFYTRQGGCSYEISTIWLLQQNSNNGTPARTVRTEKNPHKAPYEQLQEINDSWERENPSSQGWAAPDGLSNTKWSSLNWENTSIRLACRQAYGTFSWLMDDWCGRAHPTVSCSISRQLDLWWIRRQSDQTKRNKAVNSALPQPLLQILPPSSCLELLPWLPSIMDYNFTWNKLCSSQGQACLAMVLIMGTET